MLFEGKKLLILAILRKSRQGMRTHMHSVDRREGLSRWRFVRDYLWPNRPVVVTSALNDWVGLTKWNIAFFKSKLGHEPVRLQYDNFIPTRTIPFAEFLETFATYEELQANRLVAKF